MSALILVGTSIDEKIVTFYDFFFDNLALDCEFLLEENILDVISKLSWMQKKSKPSLISFETFLSSDFQKMILNALLKIIF